MGVFFVICFSRIAQADLELNPHAFSQPEASVNNGFSGTRWRAPTGPFQRDWPLLGPRHNDRTVHTV